MTGEFEVVVVGSINVDVSIVVDRFPDPGETVHGRGLHRGGGGKGANQAVAAARLGRRVALIGRVGSDDRQAGMRSALIDQGVDTSQVVVDDERSTGLAFIEVDGAGENRIVVVSGANGEVGESDLEAASEKISRASVVLAQLEVPVATVEALARCHREGLLILNPAPAAHVELTGVDILVPNRTELALLAGTEPVVLPARSEEPDRLAEENARLVDEVTGQAVALATDGGPDAVVVTLGSAGAVVVEGLGRGTPAATLVPAVVVDAVDTTGAGDAFCGALADALCLGSDLIDAVAWANRVAAVAVTRRGAWNSLPSRSDVLR